MAYNGSGTFSRLYSWVTDRSNAIKIRADRMDAEFAGIATGLSNAICKDGQTTISADIPFNNKKITGLGDAIAATHALNRQSGDARYLQLPSSLAALTDLDDGDIFGVYDLSATADKGVTYASLKTELTTDFRADGRMFPVGTRMVFQMTTPPTGWTKETGSAYADAALRFETGTIGTGGSQSFNTTFASRTFTGTVGSDTPSQTKTAAHAHTTSSIISGQPGAKSATGGGGTWTENATITSTSVGSSSAHDHTLTINAANFAVKYVEACVAQKS